jgi:hypothetical protein
MKKLYIIFSLLLLTSSLPSLAGFYLAGHGGTTKVVGGDVGIKNNLDGSNYGASFGYSLPLLLAGEVGYRHLSNTGTARFNGGTTPTEVDMGVDVYTVGARLRFLTIFNLLGGYASYKYNSKATQNGQSITNFPLNGSESGTYYGFGLRIPLPKIDLFSDLVYLTNSPTSHMNLEFGLRYFF